MDHRRADLVYATRSGTVVHIEVRRTEDPAMADRMVLYAALVGVPSLAPLALARGGVSVVPAVAAAVSRLESRQLRVSALTLALQLAPDLADTVTRELRRIGMTDVVEVLRTTEWGRGLLAEGREEGREEGAEDARREAVLTVLTRRFPDSPAEHLARSARVLVRRYRDSAITVALDAPSLDEISAE